MKFQMYIASIALCLSSVVNAASNQQLCNTTSFEAFGEPKQTVKDCPDPNEMFWVMVTIDDLRYPPQGLGLVIPLSSSDNSVPASITSQVTKEADKYKVRIRAVKDRDVINWSGDMVPGTEKKLTLNGKKVTVKFARQQN
ncbi:hypothetical protein RQM28_014085 [Citrobacter freundii]|uniref:hypothetical protein n=1 Tax=Citrobacter freundii TaxID=546 RepID=UPI0028BDE857|nr:hypothetical protein [Citrobacter freundii]EKQ7208778.1 hypothetical protein [Citrobacter freundii]MDT7337034.1 hypothetical protein [Citrobacter freundii]HCB1564211.1 hypothetical protein [Citrobacter freundii]HEB2427543.1 hypothetical protein [Citrobacter freundii]